MVAEIRRIKEIWGEHAFFELADDNSFANRAWAREFLTAIADLDLRWFTETDLSIADDDELLRLLARSGCRQILIGLESTDPRVARRARSRQLEAEAARSLHGRHQANPGPRRDRQRLLHRRPRRRHGGRLRVGCATSSRSSELLEAQVTILTPFPGTPLLRQLRAEGRLLYERFWDQCTLFDLVFEPRQMTPDELVTGHLWLMGEIYNKAQYTRRKRHYVDLMKKLDLPWYRGEREALEFFV